MANGTGATSVTPATLNLSDKSAAHPASAAVRGGSTTAASGLTAAAAPNSQSAEEADTIRNPVRGKALSAARPTTANETGATSVTPATLNLSGKSAAHPASGAVPGVSTSADSGSTAAAAPTSVSAADSHPGRNPLRRNPQSPAGATSLELAPASF